jgi:hypothetical protein
MRIIGLVLACSALLWSSCSKDKSATPTDALWAMAPASADVGVVMAPGTGEKLLAAWLTVDDGLARQPAGARIRDAIREELPPEVLDPLAHARMGLGLDRGAALFVVPGDDMVMIVPVADREAFRDALGGKAEERDGVTLDVFNDGKRCKMIEALYACSESDELLAQVGTSDALARKVAARPAHLRGDVEVHVDSRRLTEIEDLPLATYFREPGALQAALQLERGAFTVRAYLPASPGTPLIAAFVKVPDNLARSAVADKKPPGMWRLRIPISELVPGEEVTAELAPLAATVAGFDPRKDLLDNLTGEIIAYSVATEGTNAAVEIGLKQGKRLQPLITTLCSFGKAANLPVDIMMKDESCVATLDPAELKKLAPSLASIPFDGRITVAVTVTDKALRVHLSTADQGKTRSVELDPVGRNLLTGQWNLAGWGRGPALSGIEPVLLESLKGNPKEYQATTVALWMLGHIAEIGSGMAVRDDGMHAILHLVTQWANPDDVLQEFQRHLDDMLAGDVGAADRIKALAEKSPDTPLGRSYSSGISGMITPVAGLAAIGGFMTAFLQGMEQDENMTPETE